MVSVILSFFALPLGLWIIFKERRSHREYQSIFDDFLDEVKADSLLDHASKMARLRAMLEHNAYQLLSVRPTEIKAEKKIFSLGWLLFTLGFFYIGALVYIFYFYRFQASHQVKFTL